MQRLQVVWSGDQVTGPGLSTFYFSESFGGNVVTPVKNFFTAIRNVFPQGITWTIPSGGDLLNEATGELGGVWSETGGGSETSGSTNNHAQGVGCRVAWRTAAIRGGRRVRGSTFLVPLVVTGYDTQGTIAAGTITAIESAANTLLTATSGGFGVWSRPRPGLVGALVPITSCAVPDQVSWLRSRRT